MSDIKLPQKRPCTQESSQRDQIPEMANVVVQRKSMDLFIKTFQEIRPIIVRCFQEDCKEACVCECLNDRVFLCKAHFDLHLRNNESNPHTMKLINPDSHNQSETKLVTYIQNYNSDFESLKQKISTKFMEHYTRIHNEMEYLFQSIDQIAYQNALNINELTSQYQKTFDDITLLDQFIESDFQTEFTKQCYRLEIPPDLSEIIKNEIHDWNATRANPEIVNHAKMESEFDVKSSCVDSSYEGSKINSSLTVLNHDTNDPLLHWCQWETDQVNYFDFNENTQKSATIKGLNIPSCSRSISIDHNNIFLCGGQSQNLPDTNENCSKVYKLNTETQSFINLASMNTGRSDFSLTHLNGFYYALGGVGYHKKTIKTCERYSLENNRWQYIADLKKLRNSGTCVSISSQNCIYVFGDWKNSGTSNDKIERYDADINKWAIIKIKGRFSCELSGSCLLPDSSSILIFGGSDSNDESNKDCYFYNYNTNQVTLTNPLTTDINVVVNETVVLDKKIYCYFGESDSKRRLSVYDIKSGIWTLKP